METMAPAWTPPILLLWALPAQPLFWFPWTCFSHPSPLALGGYCPVLITASELKAPLLQRGSESWSSGPRVTIFCTSHGRRHLARPSTGTVS